MLSSIVYQQTKHSYCHIPLHAQCEQSLSDFRCRKIVPFSKACASGGRLRLSPRRTSCGTGAAFRGAQCRRAPSTLPWVRSSRPDPAQISLESAAADRVGVLCRPLVFRVRGWCRPWWRISRLGAARWHRRLGRRPGGLGPFGGVVKYRRRISKTSSASRRL